MYTTVSSVPACDTCMVLGMDNVGGVWGSEIIPLSCIPSLMETNYPLIWFSVTYLGGCRSGQFYLLHNFQFLCMLLCRSCNFSI